MAIGRLALLCTAGSLALSMVLVYGLMFFDGLTPFGIAMVVAVAVPLLVGLPLSLALGLLRDDFRRMGRRVNRAATYDRSTGSLSGPVLVSEIERRREGRRPGDTRKGAFMIVELAQLRTIQKRHGFTWGEEAVRVVADAVRSSVRGGDLVGRLDNSSFGVFLPGATEVDALAIGERIRAAAASVYYAPGDDGEALAVSIGGVFCDSGTDFDAMFRAAAGQVDRAHSSGVALTRLPSSQS